ncbi:class I SAM-dependent methyltransferase [Mycoplasmatota bacterium WC44]
MKKNEKIRQWEVSEGVEIIREIGVNEGANVIDFGCGFGHYSLAASIAVGKSGNIYAIDNNKGILNYVETRINDLSLTNITTIHKDETSFYDFDGSTIDCIMLYDILHGANTDRFEILKEACRILKNEGKLSILPFHLSNFRDKDGRKKKYKIEHLINEICDFEFELSSTIDGRGVHFEKYHSPYYMKKGGIDFEDLERGIIYNFTKV